MISPIWQYGWAGKDLIFGSELKALRCHPRFDATIDRGALKSFAARTYVPAPLSIYRSIFKVQPGCVLTLCAAALAEPSNRPIEEGHSGPARLQRYWSYRDVVLDGLADPLEDEAEAIEALEQSLATAIKGQSFADVPVGAFLSGGIDSSAIVALYQKYSSRPVRTYSIGFEQSGFDEAVHARAVAEHLGTIHHEQYVTVQQARDVIPLLPTMYDEPFADSSQIPTYLVSRFARQDVTVALTGDGGDEMFAGYNRHVLAPKLWRQMSRWPRPLRSAAATPLSQIPPAWWARAVGLVECQARPFIGDRIQKGLRNVQTARGSDDIYLSFVDKWSHDQNPVLAQEPLNQDIDLDLGGTVPDTVRMTYCDAVTYLPDDILCKVDRASMAVSLETRVPFLDHRVAALAARIPVALKVRGLHGKQILRQLLFRHAPRSLFDRPKAGFAVPVGEWIKGPLRDWAEDLLDPASMKADGWFDPNIVERRWRDHLAGRSDSTPALWAILMFNAWFREQRSAASLAA